MEREAGRALREGGLVRHDASGRSADFGELAAGVAKIPLAAEPSIKTPDQFKLIGHEVKRIDDERP